MSQRINKSFWFLRVILLSASFVGILLLIEKLQDRKISFDPFVPAGAEQGIDAKIVNDRAD